MGMCPKRGAFVIQPGLSSERLKHGFPFSDTSFLCAQFPRHPLSPPKAPEYSNSHVSARVRYYRRCFPYINTNSLPTSRSTFPSRHVHRPRGPPQETAAHCSCSLLGLVYHRRLYRSECSDKVCVLSFFRSSTPLNIIPLSRFNEAQTDFRERVPSGVTVHINISGSSATLIPSLHLSKPLTTQISM
jgi:hypothetical protein